MLSIQTASVRRRKKGRSRIGLALAGGGPLGGIYELGTLLALDEAIDGVSMDDLDVYVGVSSGGMIASALANNFDMPALCRMFIRNESIEQLFAPEEIFFKPAFMEYFKRALNVPEQVVNWLLKFVSSPLSTKLSESITSLGPAIPTGIFNNEAIRDFFSEAYHQTGHTDDFRELKHKLRLVAVDLNTAEPVVFGSPGFDHIPISRALQASAALPGLYSPVEIEGRQFVDGALRKTMHASAALKEGVELLLGINPIVPFDAGSAKARGRQRPRNLVDGGLPVVLSQTFRTLIYSRMVVGMRMYKDEYKSSDLALFLPDRDDPEMFFTNVFSYADRKRVCEHAYQTTRRDLLEYYDELQPILNAHGVGLRRDLLEDDTRHYWLAVDAPVEA